MAEQNAHAANLELAKNAGSRYLVQRWGDGTLCDKTGKNREVEVQVGHSLSLLSTTFPSSERQGCHEDPILTHSHSFSFIVQ